MISLKPMLIFAFVDEDAIVKKHFADATKQRDRYVATSNLTNLALEASLIRQRPDDNHRPYDTIRGEAISLVRKLSRNHIRKYRRK